jgi:hypothetical protein
MYWWLSDPAWSDSTNQRWTEQMAREVLLSLRTTYSRDERFDWRDTVGGDARREMVLRYGWPSFIYWRGLTSDTLLLSHLRLQPDRNGKASAPNVPFTSYEYRGGRVHLSPSSGALLAPFDAGDSSWTLTAPLGADQWPAFRLPEIIRDPKSDESRLRNSQNEKYANRWRELVYPRFVDSVLWWPREHMATAQRMAQLPRPQVAFLRRETNIVVGISQALPAMNEWRVGMRVPAVALISSRGPADKRVSINNTGSIGSFVTLCDSITDAPTMIGVEFAGIDSSHTLGRTRFGVRPPSTLADLQQNDVAISNPIILRASRRSVDEPPSADSALNAMAPTTTISRAAGFSVYWETYGVKLEDTVTVVLQVIPATDANAGPSFASRLFRREDHAAPVRITWRENGQSSHQRFIVPGRVPVVGRSVRIQTSMLAPGQYWLEVGVVRANEAAVQSRTSITISK